MTFFGPLTRPTAPTGSPSGLDEAKWVRELKANKERPEGHSGYRENEPGLSKYLN